MSIFLFVLAGLLRGFLTLLLGLGKATLYPLCFFFFNVIDAFSCALDDSSFTGVPSGMFFVNYILYVDKLMIFCLASLHNVGFLKDTLSNFAAFSGLYVNNAKCFIMFSYDILLGNNITSLLGLMQADNTLTYLWLPISTKKLTVAYFLQLLSRIFTLLTG